jgi:hypothetical protein
MRAKGDVNFQYCLLGSCMVRNKDEQRLYEQTWIDRLNPTLNNNRAYSTEEHKKQKRKEYQQRPEIKQYHKEYQQKPEYKQYHKEYDQKKHHCEYCDKVMVRHSIKYHCETRRHKDNYKNKFVEIFDMEIKDEEVPDYLI